MATILIVDDEEVVLNGVRRTLRANGFDEVLMCADSRNVEPLLEGEPIALILLDLMMPHIGGRELLERVASSHPEIPVIVAEPAPPEQPPRDRSPAEPWPPPDSDPAGSQVLEPPRSGGRYVE